MKGQQYDDEQKNTRKLTSAMYGDRASVNQTLTEISKYTQKQGAAMAAQQMMDDPSIYQYDEFLDDNIKKREQIVEGKKKDLTSRYITDILKASEKKRVETSVIKDKLQAKLTRKDLEQYGTEEVYITGNYRKKIEEINNFEKIDQIKEDYNKDHGMSKEKGVSSFYKSMYAGNQFVGGNRGLGFEAQNLVEKEIERRTKERDNLHNPEKILDIVPEQKRNQESRSRSREREREQLRKEEKILEEQILHEQLEKTRLLEHEEEIKNQKKQLELLSRNDKAQKAKERLQQRKELGSTQDSLVKLNDS